ncbi:MAG: hypothetical protein QM696_00635 [Steroidobacteraceae bacterium]
MNNWWSSAAMVQVRREFWEYRSLWMAPLAGAGLLLIGTLFGRFRIEPGPFQQMLATNPNMIVSGSASFFFLFIGVITSFATWAYHLDCLHAERKDRSILFWKSLPVSDARTVLTKFAVGLVIVPLAAWLLALVAHLIGSGIIALQSMDVGSANAGGFFRAWTGAQGRLLVGLLFAILWYAPVAAYLMLASVLARRSPLMMAALPLLLPILAEHLFFDTSRVARFIGHRLMAPMQGGKLLNTLGEQAVAWFSSPDVWLGLVAAAGMMYIVVRLRRYRDDT